MLPVFDAVPFAAPAPADFGECLGDGVACVDPALHLDRAVDGVNSRRRQHRIAPQVRVGDRVDVDRCPERMV